jgi:hypothetical protein
MLKEQEFSVSLAESTLVGKKLRDEPNLIELMQGDRQSGKEIWIYI